jgi:hypothetical protein
MLPSSFFIGIRFPPHRSGFSEQGHIKNISFGCINMVDLGLAQFRRNKIFLDGIGMDPIIYFGQVPTDIPAKLLFFFIFKSLKFFY